MLQSLMTSHNTLIILPQNYIDLTLICYAHPLISNFTAGATKHDYMYLPVKVQPDAAKKRLKAKLVQSRYSGLMNTCHAARHLAQED